MSVSERVKDDLLEYEGDLYSAVVTLDRLAEDFANGEIDDTFYRKQLQALIRAAYKARINLEKTTQFDVEEFIKKHKLDEKYPKGLEKLRLAEGKEGQIEIPYKELKKIPKKVADYVATNIELLDNLALRSVAKVEYIVPLLDEMKRILESFPGMKKDYWIIEEIETWIKLLEDESPSKLLDDSEIERLSFQAERWRAEFISMIGELSS